MPENPAKIDSLYRYPVKGLTPEHLSQVTLSVGQTLPSDRRYAIENGPSGFDPAAPKFFPKVVFLMLMRNERLAALRTHYDDASHVLTIRENGAESVRGQNPAHLGRRTDDHAEPGLHVVEELVRQRPGVVEVGWRNHVYAEVVLVEPH